MTIRRFHTIFIGTSEEEVIINIDKVICLDNTFLTLQGNKEFTLSEASAYTLSALLKKYNS